MASGSTGGARWRKLRAQVLERDDHVCKLRIRDVCTGTATTVDHVIPVSVWPEGRYIEQNLLAACRPCNRRKSAKLTGWRPRPDDEIDPYAF